MKNTLQEQCWFAVRHNNGVPDMWWCFGRSYVEKPFKEQKEVEVVMRNNVLEHVGIDGCKRFIKLLEEAVASVEGAQLKFRVDFDNVSDDMKQCMDKYYKSVGLSYLIKIPLFTYYIDSEATGNIAWYWFGAMMRCFQNSPRVIVSFLRLADMKWGDKNFLEHWGFLHTFYLAHVIRLEEWEKDFNVGRCENFTSSNVKLSGKVSLENYLLNNQILRKARDYRTNTKGLYAYLDDGIDSTVILYTGHPKKGVCYGLYWDDTMPKEVLLSVFVNPPKEKI